MTVEPLDIECPYCGRHRGQSCYLWAQHRSRDFPHPSRIRLAADLSTTPH